MSGVTTGDSANMPLTWKPPIRTCNPPARNFFAKSTARGNWFDCTPASATTVRWPGRRCESMMRWTGIFCTVSS